LLMWSSRPVVGRRNHPALGPLVAPVVAPGLTLVFGTDDLAKAVTSALTRGLTGATM
jgi:hypothetical protein